MFDFRSFDHLLRDPAITAGAFLAAGVAAGIGLTLLTQWLLG